jgi:hypothetical protein
LQKINPAVLVGEASEMECRLLGHVWTAPWQELSDVLQHWSGAVTCPELPRANQVHDLLWMPLTGAPEALEIACA